MPMLDLQQRAAELGRIRIGVKVTAANGRSRPSKLEAFRFTTNSRHAAEGVAALYGGEAQPWRDGTQAWEVFTTATELDVMVPPGEAALSSWWELWSGGGCQRRCDGEREQLAGGPCVCPPIGAERMEAAQTGRACKPTTRVNVILPDLPGLGVWRYESHGYHAAVELGGVADFLARAREAGAIVPATMRLEPRTKVSNGQTNRFAVVVLEIRPTLRELATAGSQSLVESLPPAPGSARAIEAGPVGGKPTNDPGAAAAGLVSGLPPAPPDDDGVVDAEVVEDAPGPGSAQELADAALCAPSMGLLTDLVKQARTRGWWDADVVVGAAVTTVSAVLFSRRAELGGDR